MKDYASLKKALAWNGDWVMLKEIPGWIIGTHWVTLALSSKLQLQLLSLLAIPINQRHVSVMKLLCIIGKLRYMQLAVTGGIGHFYAMQVTLTRDQASKNATVNLSTWFQQHIKLWQSLCVEMKTRPNYLAKLLRQAAFNIDYTDASGQGAGGFWIQPNEYGINFTWQVKWPSDIVHQLVRFTNPDVTITKSNL